MTMFRFHWSPDTDQESPDTVASDRAQPYRLTRLAPAPPDEHLPPLRLTPHDDTPAIAPDGDNRDHALSAELSAALFVPGKDSRETYGRTQAQ